MDNNQKFKMHIILKSLENSFDTKQNLNTSFWGISNSLINIKDFFKYNLISFNYKFNTKEKSIVHIFSKSFSHINNEFMNKKLNSIILFTYRNNYKPQINSKNNSIYNSDCGWGCMIRSSQMLLGRALYKIFKSEEKQKEKKINKNFLLKSVIYFFLDNNLQLIQDETGKTKTYYGMENYISKLQNYNKKNIFGIKREICAIEPPFSIQKICIIGEILGKTCGEWFSDFDLPKIYNLINESFNVFPKVKINHYNSNLELSHLLERCFKEIPEEEEIKEKFIIFNEKKYIFKKIGIIFISVRLGLESIPEEYFPSIKKLFECKEFIGLIGGKVNSASYFIGYINDDLLFLDPHYNQTSVNDLEKEGISSFINKTIYKLPLTNLQTAFTICFLCRNMEEYINFLNFCKIVSNDSNSTFHISGIKNLVINE